MDLNKKLLEALEAMHIEFGSSFPDGESTAVDMAREAMKEAYRYAKICKCEIPSLPVGGMNCEICGGYVPAVAI